MKRVVDRGLVLLALRRSLSPGVVAWSVVLLAFVCLSGAARHAGPAALESNAAAIVAGLARENVWLAFVLGVVPLVVLRSVASVAPWRRSSPANAGRSASQAAAARHGDAPWLATRPVTNASIAISTWLGASLAALALLVLFAFAAHARGGSAPVPSAIGSIDGPDARWAVSGAPLAWRADLPPHRASGRTSARLLLGLGTGAGAATEVRLSARRSSARVPAEAHAATPDTSRDAIGVERAAVARIGNRGTVEVDLPEGSGGVDFELACLGHDARVCVLSERVELWSHDSGAWEPALSVAARVALALCAWLALALGFSPFVSAATAALAVLAAWVPHWWSEAGPSAFSSRCMPGADLFEALSIVGDGRAPAFPGASQLLGCAATIAVGLGLAWIGLRSWRVSR